MQFLELKKIIINKFATINLYLCIMYGDIVIMVTRVKVSVSITQNIKWDKTLKGAIN